MRVDPLTKVRYDGVWVFRGIEVEVVTAFVQRAGGIDRASVLVRGLQRMERKKTMVGRNGGVGCSG